MNGRVLSDDIEKECVGGNKGLFPGHKPGQALYVVAVSQSVNTTLAPHFLCFYSTV